MELSDKIQPGLSDEATFTVEELHTAAHVGSGSLDVLATPVMIAFMERVAHSLLEMNLPPGYSSVGVSLEIRHLAPTPLGGRVRVQCTILDIDGPRVTFDVQAWDTNEKIGEGRHQRVVIDVERFQRRVDAKRT